MDNQQHLPKQHPQFPLLFVTKTGTIWGEFNTFTAGFTKHSAKIGPYPQCAILQPYEDRYGYLEINYVKAMPAKRRKVHRLVGDTFIAGRLLTKSEVLHHKDFNKLNNCVDNLELCTIADNNTKQDRAESKYTRLTKAEQFECICLFDTHTNAQLAEKYELSINTLIAARKGRTWKRGWQMFNDYRESEYSQVAGKTEYPMGKDIV